MGGAMPRHRSHRLPWGLQPPPGRPLPPDSDASVLSQKRESERIPLLQFLSKGSAATVAIRCFIVSFDFFTLKARNPSAG